MMFQISVTFRVVFCSIYLKHKSVVVEPFIHFYQISTFVILLLQNIIVLLMA